eukprot:2851539-Amphidinium_carterae.1
MMNDATTTVELSLQGDFHQDQIILVLQDDKVQRKMCQWGHQEMTMIFAISPHFLQIRSDMPPASYRGPDGSVQMQQG